MTTLTEVILIDDLDGSSPAKTIKFNIDKKDYLIDLSPENEQRLRDLLAPYIEKGKKVKKIKNIPSSKKKKPVKITSPVTTDNEVNEVVEVEETI